MIRLRLALTGLFLSYLISVNCETATAQAVLWTDVAQAFRKPPDSVQTSVYWYWMSDNISKQGVIKDLQAMKKVGINRAFIGIIGDKATPSGTVRIFSEEWWDILHTALKTATELNIEIGLFNSPGWSQSGGPWIKPNQAMRYLASSELHVKGPQHFTGQLPAPPSPFEDVKVIAFKAPNGYGSSLSDVKPEVTSTLPIDRLSNLVDSDPTTEISRSDSTSFSIDFTTKNPFLTRSLLIYPAHREGKAQVELQVKEGQMYRTIRTFLLDRSNSTLKVGFDPFGPLAITIPEVSATQFRLTFTHVSPTFGLAEIVFSAVPRLENFTEKTLGKMYQTPLPYWKEYQWPVQAEPTGTALMIDPKGVTDISQYMTADGRLSWAVPAGDWVIMRTGLVPTGVTNHPAAPEGTGLEVDKLNKEHIEHHFNAYLGEVIRRIPAQDRRTWKVTVADSYETGGQNWTNALNEKFKATYHYDPLPFLPVFRGFVVGSQDQSDRFLWDLRRLIADRVAYEYVGGLREVSHRNGLTTWLENYGHWGFPGEFLQYGGQSDELGGEFWSEGTLGDIENRAASSSAHIYGKTKVSAESFTAGGKTYARYPALLKKRGDRFFTEGINNTLMHVYIQQPSEDRIPGINAWFGTEFNRHNTWFGHMDLFTGYLKRANYLLQQGKYVADVAYFIGEDAPKMTGICDPPLPVGYSFDYINAEVLQSRVRVQDGRLVLPDGMMYRLLVLPPLETMRPQLLKKIHELVLQGAAILGPAPKRSPSLENYPAADQQVKTLATMLWGDAKRKTTVRRVGRGYVLSDMDMQTALTQLGVRADFVIDQKAPVLFIHRTFPTADVYFVSNQSEQAIKVTPTFRVSGKQPEAWDPLTGLSRTLPQFTANNQTTSVPLTLEPLQSLFVVFKKTAVPGKLRGTNFPQARTLLTISTPWEVDFLNKRQGPSDKIIFNPLLDWTQREEASIKYYSGTAIYRNTFTPPPVEAGKRIHLSLGTVNVMAKVRVNGQYVGGVWTAPWQLDITEVIRPGVNTLEIDVVNTWVNRLIGDSQIPLSQRLTWTNVNPYTPTSPLVNSGLVGPVKLIAIDYEGH